MAPSTSEEQAGLLSTEVRALTKLVAWQQTCLINDFLLCMYMYYDTGFESFVQLGCSGGIL